MWRIVHPPSWGELVSAEPRNTCAYYDTPDVGKIRHHVNRSGTSKRGHELPGPSLSVAVGAAGSLIVAALGNGSDNVGSKLRALNEQVALSRGAGDGGLVRAALVAAAGVVARALVQRPQALIAQPTRSAAVQFVISSTVVTPLQALSIPLMRKVQMPCRIICSLSSAVEQPCSTISLSASVSGITS